MSDLDLTDILFAQRSKPRGDEAEAHVADIYACDRKTWYRRSGILETHTREKQGTFAIGIGYELEVARTLREAGYFVQTDLIVDFDGLTGHPDLVAFIDGEEVLIECKTSKGKAKSEVSPHYAIQAAAYALALGIEKAVVVVLNPITGVEQSFEINPEGYRAVIERRAAEVIERTDPSKPMPPAEPDEIAPWTCNYCAYTQCYKNPAYESEVPA